VAERPFQPVPNTPLVADPTGDAIWKRWLQGLQRFLGDAVRGPGSSTDNAVARWDGTTGTFLNNSGVIIDDSNNVSGIANLTTTGSTILGDASADTLTINAGTWTYGANFIATRNVGALPAGASQILTTTVNATGDAGGTSNPVGFYSLIDISGSNNLAGMTTLYHQARLSGAANVTNTGLISAQTFLTSTGSVTNQASLFSALPGAFSSTGTINILVGFNSGDLGDALVTEAVGFKAQDMAGSATMSGFKSELSAGSGKKNLNITGTADNSLAGPLYLAQDNLTQQTASAMYAGTGAPNNTNGSDGDFYLRGNGTVAGSNIVYHKEAGAWVALTGGGGGGASGTTVEVDLGTPKFTGKFTITDAAISATSKVQCWQAPGPYTGKGTLADEAMMQPVQIIAVAPATGSAVVYWQTPPYVAMSQQLSNGKFGAAGATFDRLMNQRTPAVFTPTRIGKVRGNVKFTYTILT